MRVSRGTVSLVRFHRNVYMNLILWRHAEAEDGENDMKRELTKRGQTQAMQMAEWLKTQTTADARILVSPAERTKQTAQALTADFEIVKGLAPGKGVEDLLAAIDWPVGRGEGRGEGRSGRDETVIVVGHQPTLGATAALLIGGVEADWSVKKGAVWWLSNRVRGTAAQTVLRVVMSPEHLV